MRTIIFIVAILFIQIQRVFSISSFGSIFPIPLTIPNDDPDFQHCPVESGAYTHTTNCSLFHMCTFGILTTYSCIDGFFFNPSTGKCQYFPVEKDMKCTEIVKELTEADYFLSVKPVKGYDYYHRRKSSTSECTQTGIYPDVLDCSLFHYCHQNKKHEIFQCPNGLHFDPKIFMCSPKQLVNCQYEPPIEIDDSSTIKSNTICRDYTAGTYLPVANKFDQFIICQEDGTSTLNKCPSDTQYNALTKKCEINKVYTSMQDLVQSTDDQIGNQKSLTTTRSIVENDRLEETILPNDVNDEEKLNFIENLSHLNSPLSRMFHRLNANLDHQNRVTELTQVVFVTVFALIGLILLASMIFGAIVCIRMMFSSPSEHVGTWKVLTEESKV